MAYSVGNFLDPRPSDPLYDDLAEALADAKAKSDADDNDAAAVWQEDELLVVYLRGYVLKPVQ